MPNWVNNKLRVEKKYLNQIVNEEGNVDFNIALPMPESLNVESSSRTEQAIMYYLTNRHTIPLGCLKEDVRKIIDATVTNGFSKNWAQTVFIRTSEWAYNAREYEKDKMYRDGEQYVNNYKNYGATTWYEWWNAFESKITKIDDNTVMCSFDTPWSAPEKWLRELTSKNVPFYCEWIEEQGYHGEYISDGTGKLVSNDLEMVE